MAHSSGRGEGGFNPKQKHRRNNPSTAFEASGHPTRRVIVNRFSFGARWQSATTEGVSVEFSIKDYSYARSCFFQQ
jgi:hypothetical protein